MVSLTILAGGYSSYVAVFRFSTDDNSLTYLNKYHTGDNPTWITSHPVNKSVLYATNENQNGAIQSFVVGSQGALTLVDTTSSGGSTPAHCAGLFTSHVAVPNFSSGSASLITVDNDHVHFQSGDPVTVKFPVPSTGKEGAAQPHMAYEYQAELFIPDRGNDKIWRLCQDGCNPGEFVVHGEIQQPIGSGPRHIHIRDNMLYTLHEFSNSLTLQKLPSFPNGTSQILSSVSITPPNPPHGYNFAAAEILIPEPTEAYPTPYIYVSNRNMGTQDPRGDTIAVFENVNGQLVLRNQVYTGLNQIRGMMSGEQAGFGGEAYIVAGGAADQSGIKVLQRTNGGANLEEVAASTDVPYTTTFVWLNDHQVLPG